MRSTASHPISRESVQREKALSAGLAIAVVVLFGNGCHLLGLSPIQCEGDNNCPFGQRCSVDEGVCVSRDRDAGAPATDAGVVAPDAGVDAGLTDGGPDDVDGGVDSGVDAGPIDAGGNDGGPAVFDAGPNDSGPDDVDSGVDAGVHNAGANDAGPNDAGVNPFDAGLEDAGPNDVDAGALDAGPLGPFDSGVVDAGPLGTLDAGVVDAGQPPLDAGPLDAGPLDAGPPDAGVIDAGPPQACIDTLPIGLDGGAIGTTTGLESSLFTSCGLGPSGEVAFHYSTPVETGIRAVLTSGPSADHILELRLQCDNTLDSVEICIDNGAHGEDELITFTAEANVDYTFIVDTYEDRHGPFELVLEAALPLEDMCLTAPTLDAISGTETGSFFGRFDYFDSEDYGLCTGYFSVGNDAVYAVTLGVGDRFDATLTHEGDESLYILDSCASAPEATCVVGADAHGNNPESVSFTAAEAGVYFVVVDSFMPFTGTYELMWQIFPAGG